MTAESRVFSPKQINLPNRNEKFENGLKDRRRTREEKMNQRLVAGALVGLLSHGAIAGHERIRQAGEMTMDWTKNKITDLVSKVEKSKHRELAKERNEEGEKQRLRGKIIDALKHADRAEITDKDFGLNKVVVVKESSGDIHFQEGMEKQIDWSQFFLYTEYLHGVISKGDFREKKEQLDLNQKRYEVLVEQQINPLKVIFAMTKDVGRYDPRAHYFSRIFSEKSSTPALHSCETKDEYLLIMISRLYKSNIISIKHQLVRGPDGTPHIRPLVYYNEKYFTVDKAPVEIKDPVFVLDGSAIVDSVDRLNVYFGLKNTGHSIGKPEKKVFQDKPIPGADDSLFSQLAEGLNLSKVDNNLGLALPESHEAFKARLAQTYEEALPKNETSNQEMQIEFISPSDPRLVKISKPDKKEKEVEIIYLTPQEIMDVKINQRLALTIKRCVSNLPLKIDLTPVENDAVKIINVIGDKGSVIIDFYKLRYPEKVKRLYLYDFRVNPDQLKVFHELESLVIFDEPSSLLRSDFLAHFSHLRSLMAVRTNIKEIEGLRNAKYLEQVSLEEVSHSVDFSPILEGFKNGKIKIGYRIKGKNDGVVKPTFFGKSLPVVYKAYDGSENENALKYFFYKP